MPQHKAIVIDDIKSIIMQFKINDIIVEINEYFNPFLYYIIAVRIGNTIITKISKNGI